MQKIEEYIKLPKSERQKHLNLLSSCIIRGTTSTHCRGILAHFLNTSLNTHKIDCCHACHNPDCSNPEHLYWGTRSENMYDMYCAKPEIKENIKKKATGQHNNQYNIKPWRNTATISYPETITYWKKAEYIYINYYKNNWNFSKYGKGETYFQKEYNISRSSLRVMLKMFKSGWNPSIDVDYQKFLIE